MKHLGDITKLKGSEVPLVDVVCGGSPCQDLSVAGKRAGLDGARSGLFMEQIRLIKEMRDYDRAIKGADVDIRLVRPRYMVWENVPGAFSSNKGEDFRCVLEETAKIVCEDAVIPGPPRGGRWTPSGCIMGDGWSIAWRVHDAQFWGVPQRRKRIALVADFGGTSAPEILFERKGLSGNTQQSRETGKGIAGGAKSSVANTVYCLQGNGIDRADTAGCNGKGWREDKSYTLNTIDRPAVCSYQKVTGSLMASGYDKLGTQEAANDMYVVQSWDGSQTAPTLTANNAGGGQRMPDKDNFNAVITYGLDRASFNQGKNALYDFSVEEEKAQTIVAKGPGGDAEHKETVGALCARDYKGVGSQYVNEGKIIIQKTRTSTKLSARTGMGRNNSE